MPVRGSPVTMPSGESASVARYISMTLNPPFIAAFTFAVLVAAEGSPNWDLVLLIAMLFAAVVPVASIYLLVRMGVIPDVDASERKTRVFPFIAAVASYTVGFSLLVAVGAPALISALMLCYLVNTIIVTFITLGWKISIHASGIAGPAAALGTAFGPVGFLFLLLVIPVGWARVTLKAHSILQVGAGAILAVLLTFLELRAYIPLL